MAKRSVKTIRRLAWSLCALPLLWLATLTALHALGADPVAFLTRETGLISLRLLMAALLVSPFYRWTHWTFVPPLRRVFGLGAFYYGCLHLAVYLTLNQHLNAGFVLRDLHRPYIIAGDVSLLLALPLALTSTDRMMRALGRRWKVLHRLVYLVAIAAVLHYALLLKIDFRPGLGYGLALGLLLGWRLFDALAGRLRNLRVQAAGASLSGPEE